MRENINLPENETGSPNCHRECLELKERTSRLRIKKGISQKDLEHVIQNKASKEKMNEVFQQAIDSYLQVQRLNFSFFYLVLKKVRHGSLRCFRDCSIHNYFRECVGVRVTQIM